MSDDEPEPENSILQLPELTREQQLKARLEALGMRPDEFDIAKVERTKAGALSVDVELILSAEAVEKLTKLLSIKLFTPEKDTVTVGRGEVKLTEPPSGSWSSDKRSKTRLTKTDTDPDRSV